MSEVSPWISVGDLAQAFAPDSNTPSSTGELAGITLGLNLENGQLIELRFETGDQLSWAIAEGTGKGRSAEETYVATKVRDAVYFVDFVRHLERATTVSLVIDRGRGIATVLLARLPDETETRQSLGERVTRGKELTAVRATFLSAAIDTPFTAATPRHPPTRELVGKRVEYSYSATERYEHIYLNENLYTWHCLAGSEKGLADTDRCHCYKIADNLFFFVWREKIVPTLGAVLVDFDLMRTAGKIFGYEGADFGRVSNFPVGAHARLLSVTS